MVKTKSTKWVYVAILAAIWLLLAVVSPVFGQPSQARIAVLTPGLTAHAELLEDFRGQLSRLGYREGKNIAYIVDDTQGSTADLSGRAAKLLTGKPDALLTITTIHTTAAKKATSTVPIVFAWVGNPVQDGLIADYASSKNNLTGVSSSTAPLSGKRLEALLEVAPKIKRVLTIVTIGESISLSTYRYITEAADKMGVRLVRRDAANREEIERILGGTPRGAVDAIYYVPSVMMVRNVDLLIRKAKADRIPLVVHEDALVEQGALMSYGPESRLVGIQAAALMDKVLKGAKPSDIVVEIPNKLCLAVNVTTAREIGLTIPRGILERANRLVE
jgi:putative ABC transport system substrate-binding protein